MTAATTDQPIERPWETMEPRIKLATMQLTAKAYGVAQDDFIRWCDAYTAHFAQGPDVFIPWYKRQRNMLSFEPYYPHEMYPQLIESGAAWLYEHPEWIRP